MRIKADGVVVEAEITTNHPAASYRQPVLLVHGAPVGPGDAREAKLLIVEASEDERAELARGGYSLPDVPDPDAITGYSGLALGTWDGLDVGQLRAELDRIEATLPEEIRIHTIDMTALPHAEQVPEDLATHTGYPIWACDKSGFCLTGEGAREIEQVSDIRARLDLPASEKADE
ncbi:MAG TPA: hypothetical protein VM425_12120 [Myxococcota bacterium]|nr:hypothetical protein [Myxococcota bacterium]